MNSPGWSANGNSPCVNGPGWAASTLRNGDPAAMRLRRGSSATRSCFAISGKDCCLTSAEHALKCRRLHRRIQMAVSPPLLFALMADPFVNQPLIDAVAGTGGNEAMAEDMIAANLLPFGVGQR